MKSWNLRELLEKTFSSIYPQGEACTTTGSQFDKNITQPSPKVVYILQRYNIRMVAIQLTLKFLQTNDLLVTTEAVTKCYYTVQCSVVSFRFYSFQLRLTVKGET